MIADRQRVWILIALLTLNFGTVFLDRNALGFLAPFVVQDLHLSNMRIGLLASATSLMWALSGMIATPILARSLRPRTILVSLGFLTAAGMLATALAGSFATLMAARLAAGAFAGPVLPISQAITAAAATKNIRGLQMGAMQSVGSSLVGSVIGPSALVAAAQLMGWRNAVVCAAGAGAVSAVLLLYLLRIPVPFDRTPLGRDPSRSAVSELAHRNILLCSVISILMVGWLITNLNFLPLYLTREAGLSTAQMGVLMGVSGFGGLAGALIFPHLSDRFGRRRAIAAAASLGAVGPVLILLAPHGALIDGSLLFCSSLASGTFPMFMATVPSESVALRAAPTAVGLIQGVGECVGGVSIPLLAGYISDGFGLSQSLLVVSGCALAATFTALLLVETAPASRTEMATT